MAATKRKTTAKKTTAKKKTTTRKTAAKKAPAKKKTTTTRKTTAKKKAPAKKTTAKKSTAKKTTARKTTAKKKTTTRKKSASISVGRKPFTKSQVVGTISEMTELPRKDVSEVISALADIIAAHVNKKGPGVFSIPGLMKVKVVKKPATKARKGINPFTGEEMMFKAKPATRKVKVLPLKALKEMALS